MSISCECRVLSGRGLCDGSIPRPEESYQVYFKQITLSHFEEYMQRKIYLLHYTQYGKEDGRHRCKGFRVTIVAVEEK